MKKGLAFRTIDGSQNNLAQPELNAAGTDFTRVGLAHFADGVSTPVMSRMLLTREKSVI